MRQQVIYCEVSSVPVTSLLGKTIQALRRYEFKKGMSHIPTLLHNWLFSRPV